jgi:hypothetical protein
MEKKHLRLWRLQSWKKRWRPAIRANGFSKCRTYLYL